MRNVWVVAVLPSPPAPRKRTPLLLLLIGFAACSLQLEVQPGAMILCDTDEECPSNYRCNVHAGLCAPADSSDMEGPQPLAAAQVVPPIASAGSRVVISFAVNEPLARDPEVTFVNGGATLYAELESSVLGSSPAYTFFYPTSGSEEETASLLQVFLVDKAGNETHTDLGATLAFDFAEPGVLDTSAVHPLLRIEPGDDSPLLAVSALSVGATAEVSFVTDELVASAEVRAHSGIDFTIPCAGVGATFSCAYTLPESDRPLDDSFELQAVLSDLAGNPNVVPLGLTLEVDTVAPCPPRVDVDADLEGAILYEREPWGRSTEAGERDASFFVSGLPESVESGSAIITVIVYAAAEPSSANEIARTVARAAGSFGDPEDATLPLYLGTIDREVVFLTAVDQAGNESGGACAAVSPVALAVRNVSWTATMRGKRSMSSFENPNDFELRELFLSTQLRVPNETSIDGERLAAADARTVSTLGAGTWRDLTPGDSPSPGNAHGALAYDAARAKLVRFGGVSCSVCNGVCAKTNEGTQGSWRTVPTRDPEADQDPALRWFDAMAYDPVDAGVLLFGGAVDPGRAQATNDTWLWTGVSWKELCKSEECQAQRPAPRSGHALAGDPFTRKVYLFGGRTGDGTLLSDLWEWNGSRWRELCTSSPCADLKPSARDQHAMTFDTARRELVLVGGNPASDETWTFDGSVWTLRCGDDSCTPHPGARWAHSMAHDPSGKVVLFGGLSNRSDLPCGGGEAGVYSDTWIWDGDSWTEALPNNVDDPTLPGARYGHQLAYDPSLSRTVMVGGMIPCVGTVCMSDFGSPSVHHQIWEWDGSTWKLAGGSGGPWPRSGAAMAYDSSSGLTWMFGGNAEGSGLGEGSAPRSDLWSWDGTAWQGAWAPGMPSARSYHALGIAEGSLWIYGGTDGDGPLDDMYSLSLTSSSSWSTVCTDCTASPGRWGHSLAADASGLVTFGGFSAGYVSADESSTWRLEAGAWTDACSGEACSAPTRGGYAMASDPSTGQVFVFGGISGYSPVRSLWRWDGSGWSDITPGEGPVGRSFSAAAFDSGRARLLLFGGGITRPGLSEALSCDGSGYLQCADTWEWDGDTWSRPRISDVEGDGRPALREGHAMTYDSERHQVLLFGGFNARDGVLGDTWIWDGGASRQPAHILKARFTAAGIDNDEDQTLTGVQVRWLAGGVGYPGGEESAGISLLVWDVDHWEEVDSRSGSPTAMSELLWTAPVDLPLERLLAGTERTVFVAVTPPPNGTGYAQVDSDYAEVVIRYRRRE